MTAERDQHVRRSRLTDDDQTGEREHVERHDTAGEGGSHPADDQRSGKPDQADRGASDQRHRYPVALDERALQRLAVPIRTERHHDRKEHAAELIAQAPLVLGQAQCDRVDGHGRRTEPRADHEVIEVEADLAGQTDDEQVQTEARHLAPS